MVPRRILIGDPPWWLIVAVGIAALMVYVLGCAAKAPEVHGDNARVTNISLKSLGEFGVGFGMGLLIIVLWLQKRTREAAAMRIIEAVEHCSACELESKHVKGRVLRNPCEPIGPSTPRRDGVERWINRQVKRL